MALPGTHAPAHHPPLLTAFVAVAPTSISSPLEVVIPAVNAQRSVVAGWVPRMPLPSAGDECLVAYDEHGDPWVIGWQGGEDRPLFIGNGRDAGVETAPQVKANEYVQSGYEGSNVTFNLPDPKTCIGAVVGCLYYGSVPGKATVKTAAGNFYGAGWKAETEVRLRPGDFFFAVSQPLVGGNVWIVIAPTRSDRTLLSGTSIAATISNPYDGQEVEYQNAAMAEQGVVWKFRYRAASANAFKWEKVGGSPLTSDVATSEATGGGQWVNLATFGPALTTPLAGIYNFEWGAAVSAAPTVAFLWFLSLFRTGVAAVRENSMGAASQGGSSFAGTLASKWALEVEAGVQYQLAYGVIGFNASYHDRYLTMDPVRVA